MNLQDIIYPIRDLFMWTFDILKAGGQNFNYLLITLMSIATVYWIAQLVKFEKNEVPNR